MKTTAKATAALALLALAAFGLYTGAGALVAHSNGTPAPVSYSSADHLSRMLTHADHSTASKGGAFVDGADVSGANVQGVHVETGE